MPVTLTRPTDRTGRWTETQLEALVIELLADLLNEDSDDLERCLREEGGQMPVDSLDMVDILKDFRQRTGLKIPIKKLKNRTMRSVRRFAEFVAEECQ